MTSKQRAYLKSLASSLDPIFQIGRESLTPEVTEAISEAFNTKELIKIAVLKNCFDDPGRNGPDDCRADEITGGTGDRQKNSSL